MLRGVADRDFDETVSAVQWPFPKHSQLILECAFVLAYLFESPANPHIPGQSLALVGRVLEGGYDRTHPTAPS